MKKLTLMAAALSACLASTAYAASTDQAPNVGTGDGISGDLVLAAVNSDRSSSLMWDLSSSFAGLEDLTHGQLLDWSAANQGASFTINNAQVGTLIDNSWDWHVFSIANRQGDTGTFDDAGFAISEAFNYGALTTVDAGIDPTPITGIALQTSVNAVASFVQRNNSAGLVDNGVLVAGATDPFRWDNGNNEHGDNTFGGDTTKRVGETANVQLLKKASGPVDDFFDALFNSFPGSNNSSILSSDIGSFLLEENGDLTFTAAAPIPVPAAIWLFGSALAGLAVKRRSRV